MSASKASPHPSDPPGLTLRAMTRRKRPSFSPQKWRSEPASEQQKQRSQSHSTGASCESFQKELQGLDPTMRNPKTAALEFEEFSYVDDQGIFRTGDSAFRTKLMEYLGEHYQALYIDEMEPYLVVWCGDKVPPPSERPFMIAGLVAVWLVHGKDEHPLDMDLGQAGCSKDEPWLWLEQTLLDDLKPWVIPKTETLSAIMDQHFPEALAVSYINYRIVVEFKEVTEEQHKDRLDSLPCDIAYAEVELRYFNGPTHGQELNRFKAPNPTKLDGQYDDTDYVKEQGCFYPGAMLSSKNNTLISAGIQVQKQEKIGLTVAIHCWEKQLDSDVKLGHEDYTVKQGDWATGTVVGKVTERIGSSDIGVAMIDRPFSNRFLDLHGSASSLLHSQNVRRINEKFWIDSFVTGPQKLASAGKRVYKANERGKDLFGDASFLPGPGTYITLSQGIYSTAAPEINSQPKIREGVCGAAIVRAQKIEPARVTLNRPQEKKPTLGTGTSAGQGSSDQVSTPKESTPSSKRLGKAPSTASLTPVHKRLPEGETTGEVAGFMHWSDLQSLYNAPRLLCFADSVDGLIEDGWEVVPVREKRKADAADMDEDSDPFVANKSPKK